MKQKDDVLEVLRSDKEPYENKVGNLHVEIEGYIAEAAEQYQAGYGVAISHAQAFFLDFDFLEFDPFKDVVDGKFIDLSGGPKDAAPTTEDKPVIPADSAAGAVDNPGA